MKYYKGKEQIVGFDFYCDVANNIAKARHDKEWTLEELANKTKITASRLSRLENVQTRIELGDLKKLSESLERSVDWFIDADIDSQSGECLYLVGINNEEDFKLYIKATSSQMATLLFYKKLRDSCVRLCSRDRFIVDLVGIPVGSEEIKKRFLTCKTSEEITLERD